MKTDKKLLITREIYDIRNEHDTDPVFQENEVRANLLVGSFLLVCASGIAICWLLNVLDILAVGSEYTLIFPIGITLLVIPAVICLAFHGRKKWIKYLTMLSFLLTAAYLDSILTYNVPLLIIIPVSFSCWYYSRSFTVQVSLLTTLFFTVSAFCGAYFNMQTPDKNFMTGELSSYIRAIMLQSFLPRWMIFVVISAVCYVIASRGRAMVLQQDAVSKSQAKVETELDMAGRIQKQALPLVSELPPCPFRSFDLAAKMNPAREVGGDFFDFFYLDPTHLVLIVADVADKGIAASLYMMMSKLMLDNKLTLYSSPGQVLETVNQQLHKKSLKGMFVTVWLGILDLKSGDLITANAGHEYPILRQKENPFHMVHDKHGFVLGGISGMKYPETHLHLEEGDVLFLYTDGVLEANDPHETQFGEDRLLSVLNRHPDDSMEDLIDSVRDDLNSFASGMGQFDDITMLALKLGPLSTEPKITVKPSLSEMDSVQSFVNQMISQANLPPLRAKKLSICVDEVFSNIVKYSGASVVSVSCHLDSQQLRLRFLDDGKPFDPLSGTPPDFSKPVAERIQGGLGIFITKNYTDGTDYSRLNEKNELTLFLNLSSKEDS